MNISPIVREHLVSAGQTFFSVFLTVIATTLSSGEIAWTGAFWASVLLVGVRAGIKEVFARLATTKFGGRK